jgi:long-chain acyl-CoA synthetase
VYGEPNAIVGNIVCARVRLREAVDQKTFASALKRHCTETLERFKVPVKVTFDDTVQYSERFKKSRASTPGDAK